MNGSNKPLCHFLDASRVDRTRRRLVERPSRGGDSAAVCQANPAVEPAQTALAQVCVTIVRSTGAREGGLGVRISVRSDHSEEWRSYDLSSP
jgi:hypothetical protein